MLWGCVVGVSLAAWDGWRWLETGQWTPWRVGHGLVLLFDHETQITAWLHDPNEWIGLNKVAWMLLDLPASVAVVGFLFLLGLGLCWLATSGDAGA